MRTVTHWREDSRGRPDAVKTAMRNWRLMRAARTTPNRFWTPQQIATNSAELNALKTDLRNPLNFVLTQDQQALNGAKWGLFKDGVRDKAVRAGNAALMAPARVNPTLMDLAVNYGDDAVRGVHGALSHLGLG